MPLGYFGEEDCVKKCKSDFPSAHGCERYWDGECFAHTGDDVVIGGYYKDDTSAWTCWVFGTAGTLVLPTGYM